uniref:Uncharacterized protein n=1 Tax=Romanomermis culicivorax TaxID=13658 RepID=A0A915JH06_ROMCU
CSRCLGTDSIVSFAAPTEIHDAGQHKPINDTKTTGDVSVIALYQPTEGTPAPLARFIAQGPPPGIPKDSALEVASQLESMNLLDSSFVTDAMRATWSTDLATKCLQPPTWCYQRQRHWGYWDPMLLDERSSLSPTELFTPPQWTRSCRTVNRHRRQWTPSATLWNKQVATRGPQQLLRHHHQQRQQEPKHWWQLPSSNQWPP